MGRSVFLKYMEKNNNILEDFFLSNQPGNIPIEHYFLNLHKIRVRPVERFSSWPYKENMITSHLKSGLLTLVILAVHGQMVDIFFESFNLPVVVRNLSTQFIDGRVFLGDLTHCVLVFHLGEERI